MYKDSAMSALKDAIKTHRAFTRWFEWCEGLQAARVASGLYEKLEYDKTLSVAVETLYIELNKRPAMPSKTRKHQMYGDIYRAAVLANLEVPAGSIRTMEDVAQMIAKVTARLATA